MLENLSEKSRRISRNTSLIHTSRCKIKNVGTDQDKREFQVLQANFPKDLLSPVCLILLGLRAVS